MDLVKYVSWIFLLFADQVLFFTPNYKQHKKINPLYQKMAEIR